MINYIVKDTYTYHDANELFSEIIKIVMDKEKCNIHFQSNITQIFANRLMELIYGELIITVKEIEKYIRFLGFKDLLPSSYEYMESSKKFHKESIFLK